MRSTETLLLAIASSAENRRDISLPQRERTIPILPSMVRNTLLGSKRQLTQIVGFADIVALPSSGGAINLIKRLSWRAAWIIQQD